MFSIVEDRCLKPKQPFGWTAHLEEGHKDFYLQEKEDTSSSSQKKKKKAKHYRPKDKGGEIMSKPQTKEE